MQFTLSDGTTLLRRTPGALRAFLTDLPDGWITVTEGPGTWSPFDVVGHLIHGERADWIPRIEHILQHGDAQPFPPFDREAIFEASKGHSLADLLDTFDVERTRSLARLHELSLGAADLSRPGLHPAFGQVTLGQHLSTWVVHDLTHLNQIARTLAAQYAEAVGPWRAYLSILGTAPR